MWNSPTQHTPGTPSTTRRRIALARGSRRCEVLPHRAAIVSRQSFLRSARGVHAGLSQPAPDGTQGELATIVLPAQPEASLSTNISAKQHPQNRAAWQPRAPDAPVHTLENTARTWRQKGGRAGGSNGLSVALTCNHVNISAQITNGNSRYATLTDVILNCM